MTRALILAAGQGTRLYPLTHDRPKCLIDLCGRSLLSQQVQALQACGITDIHIVTGYLKEQIEALGFSTSFNSRFHATNMVESVFSAMAFLEQGGDLIIAYGDIVYEPENLARLLACDHEMAIMVDRKWFDLWSLRFENPREDAETLILDNEGYIVELGKKLENYHSAHGQYTGLIKIRNEKVKDFIAFYQNLDREALYDGQNFDTMYLTSFIQRLIDSGWKVKACLVDSGWLEVDSIGDLETYERLQRKGDLVRFYKLGEP